MVSVGNLEYSAKGYVMIWVHNKPIYSCNITIQTHFKLKDCDSCGRE